MPATCCQCDQVTNRFSQSEYRAAVRDNDGECRDCKAEIPRCTDCGREFHSGNFKSRLNALKMHKQTHRRKTVQCPVCEGEKRYASGADALLHLESGYCPGCRGKDNARTQIYKFVSRNAPCVMSDRLMIENGDGGVPSQAYRCNECGRSFDRLSSLMQHQNSKHGGGNSSSLRIGY